MHLATRVLIALTVVATGCGSVENAQPTGRSTTSATPTTTAPFTSPAVDWNDRTSVRISLPSGWTIAACEGDAPFLCASTNEGVIDGTIMLVEYPALGQPFTRENVEADAAELYRVTETDRQATCGADFHLEHEAVSSVPVGGKPGFRFGYQLRDATEKVTEHVVLHVVGDGTRTILINTAFSDPNGCPGEDPERIEFPIESLTAIEPYLDEIASKSVLPIAASNHPGGAPE